jgi:phosphomannomutase/phosphoglucomutase
MDLRLSEKREAPAKYAAESAARNQARTLTAFWISGLVGVALVLLLAFAAGLFLWSKTKEEHSLRQLQSCTGMIVRDLSNSVASLQGRLREWGGDPQLRETFRNPTFEGLQSREESLTRLIPGALRVRLVNPGLEVAGDSQKETLSYAGLDLIHQAVRQQGVTLLEMHRLGSSEEHLAIAAPVMDEDGQSVLGVIHVSLPPSVLPALANVAGESGWISFQQRVGDQVATVDPERRGVVPVGLPDHQSPVRGTRLRVAAWSIASGPFDVELLLVFAVAYLVSMMSIALVLWLPLRGIKQAQAMDYAGVVALVEDAVARRPMRRLPCRLAETGPVIDVLTRLLRALQPARGGAAVSVTDEPPVASERAADARQPATVSDEQSEEAPDQEASQVASEVSALLRPESVPAEIFRAYDIRGVVDMDLTPELMQVIGLAVGTEATEAGDQTVIVGRDTRASGEELSESLITGLRDSGCDVLDLGVVPTPLVYFATRYQGETSGVAVTASHNPESYNGLKVVISGSTLAGDRIAALRERILTGAFSQGDGAYQVGDLVSDYVGHVERDVAIARTLKVVVDCGNATASVVAPQLYRALGCELIELNCNPDAGFPEGRVPDPARPECLEALQHAVVSQGADLGLAFDGDGDRLGVVDSLGKIIWPDRVLMLLAADVLSRHPGTDVVFDVKSSHHLATEILRNGGRPVMWKSGHSPLKNKLMETGALLAGEWSGHIIFRERWFGFDDALYSGARLLEVLALDSRPSAEVFAGLPEALGTPELFLYLSEGQSEDIMKSVLGHAAELSGLELYTEDGLRAESQHGWGLVRASNTQPALVFRFEADDQEELEKIQDLFRQLMGHAAPGLQLPF